MVAAYEGGPTGFGGGNIMVGVSDSIEIDDNPLPKISVMPLLRRVASWSLHMRGQLTGVNARRE